MENQEYTESEVVLISFPFYISTKRNQKCCKVLISIGKNVYLSPENDCSIPCQTWSPQSNLSTFEIVPIIQDYNQTLGPVISPESAIGVIASYDTGRYVKLVFDNSTNAGIKPIVIKRFSNFSHLDQIVGQDRELGYDVLILKNRGRL